VLRAIERDLKKHYEDRYRALRADSGRAALDLLYTISGFSHTFPSISPLRSAKRKARKNPPFRFARSSFSRTTA
jgi:hypothetical protein